EALEIDPRYAPAWQGLAGNFNNRADLALVPSQEGYAHARESTNKALAIDPDYAPAHARLGDIAMYRDNNPTDPAQHFQRPVALDSTNLDVLRNAASFLTTLGRPNDAIELLEAVARRDPVNLMTLGNLGYQQRMAGRYDAAITSLHAVLNLSPNRSQTHYLLGTALMLKGNAPAALAEMEQEKADLYRMIGLP